MSPFASLFVLAAIIFVAATLTIRAIRHAPTLEPEPSTWDNLDNPNTCNEHRPHTMLPTSYGWRCANNCGESWYVDPDDALAAADLAMWEIENDWQVEA